MANMQFIMTLCIVGGICKYGKFLRGVRYVWDRVTTILMSNKNMIRVGKSIILMQLFFLMVSCAQLPKYARPHVREIDHKQESLKQGFTYRPLTVNDFRALSLPKKYKLYTENINAQACIQIRPTRDSKSIVTWHYFDKQIFYFGTIEYVAFEAVMIPSCSWWNPLVPKQRFAYVLEHEQIHFALMELAARKLTHEAREVTKSFVAIQTTYKDAQSKILAKIEDMIRSASENSLKKHTAFDQDTSLHMNPEKQRWWLELVEGQLQKTAPKTSRTSAP